MFDCDICKTRHSENPETCRHNRDRAIGEVLSKTFEGLLKQAGDNPEVRLLIANYTLGYMGVSYGLHVK